jgi:ABC-type uncharacterized transport system involved in gliding motility auxiliary subunit
VNLQLLQARQTKYTAYATIYILVVVAALAIVNILANRHDKSYDATANKRYSLSEQTAKIVKGLNQDATITYYDQSTRVQHAKDLLDQYANLSSKIHIEYVDPDKKLQEAREAGIKNYGTTVVQIGARKEEAKSLTEEDITGAFIRDLKQTTRTACFAAGSGEHQIDDSGRTGYSQFKGMLAKENYETKSIDLLQSAVVPSDCTVLIIGGPTHDYQQPEVDAIKKYVEDGGRALVMVDPPLKIGKAETADNSALTSLLQSWGVTPEKDLVIDMNPLGQILGVGPTVTLVSSYDAHPIVSELKGTATGFPLARSLEIKAGAKSTPQPLFSSSPNSMATTNLSSASVNTSDPNNKKGPLTIAAAGTYNTGKQDSEGRFVVVGSSSWAANSFLQFNGNGDLALNAIDWLASAEDLISIRPKSADDRRLNMTRSQLVLVRSTSQFLLPLAVVFVGFSVWWKGR